MAVNNAEILTKDKQPIRTNRENKNVPNIKMSNPPSKAKKPNDTSESSSTDSDSSSSGSTSDSGTSGSSSTSSTSSLRKQTSNKDIKKVHSDNSRDKSRGVPHSSTQPSTNKAEKGVVKKTDALAKKVDPRNDKNSHYLRSENMEKDAKSTHKVYQGRSPKAGERHRDNKTKPVSTHVSKSNDLSKRTDTFESKNKNLHETHDKIPQSKNMDTKEGEQMKDNMAASKRQKTSHSKSSTRTPSPKLKDDSRKRGDVEKRHHSPQGGRSGYSRSTKRRHSPDRKDAVKSAGPVLSVPDVKPTKLHVGHLTRHVTTEHLKEIFGNYGQIKAIEMPPDRNHTTYSRGYAYVEFENHEEAEKAQKFMNSGQIDGQEITVAFVLTMTTTHTNPAAPANATSRAGDRGHHRHPHNNSSNAPRKEGGGGYNEGSSRRREGRRSGGDGGRRGAGRDDMANRSSNRQHHAPQPSSRSDPRTSSRSTRPSHRSDDKRTEQMRESGRSGHEGRRDDLKGKGSESNANNEPSQVVVGKEEGEAAAKKTSQSSNVPPTAAAAAAPNQGGKAVGVVVQHGGVGSAKANAGTIQAKKSAGAARGAGVVGGGQGGKKEKVVGTSSSSSSSNDNSSDDSSSSSDSDEDASSSDNPSPAGTAPKRPAPSTTKPAPAPKK